jgi:hypothetical protein
MLAVARERCSTLRRRCWWLMIPVVAVMFPAVWFTRDSFLGGSLAGVGFSVSVGLVGIDILRFTIDRELLASVTPLQCVQLETAMREPAVASYLGAIQRQGRVVTRLEADEILRYARKTLELVNHEHAVNAWRAVHGTQVEQPSA